MKNLMRGGAQRLHNIFGRLLLSDPRNWISYADFAVYFPFEVSSHVMVSSS